MHECGYCGNELMYVTKYETSEFYRCNGCDTVWDIVYDATTNSESKIDVQRYLDVLCTRKKLAS